jgi:hypothetical protein
MDFLMFHLDPPCPTLLGPAGGPPLKWPYGCFRGSPPAGQPVLYPFGHPTLDSISFLICIVLMFSQCRTRPSAVALNRRASSLVDLVQPSPITSHSPFRSIPRAGRQWERPCKLVLTTPEIRKSFFPGNNSKAHLYIHIKDYSCTGLHKIMNLSRTDHFYQLSLR